MPLCIRLHSYRNMHAADACRIVSGSTRKDRQRSCNVFQALHLVSLSIEWLVC